MSPPAQEPSPAPRRLSSEERAARNREIARRRLEGGSVNEVAAEFGVSRATVKRAARDHVRQLRREEEPEALTALGEVDVEALISLGLTANGEALRTGLRILRRGRDDQITVAAGNMVGRALSALVVALIRTGYLPEPGDEYLRRRAERMDEVWGVALARMAERGGLTDEEFERVLGRVSDDARFQGGLALDTTTNGKEH